MGIKTFYLTLVLVLIWTQNSKEYRFRRRIEAIGSPYYNILMVLGSCSETVLFIDQKIWSKMLYNRVLDIAFKADNERYKVSKAEIRLVINNTSSYAYSEEGVGKSEFYASLYLPTNLNFVFYSLTIYSCYRDRDSAGAANKSNTKRPFMPFLHLQHDQSNYYKDNENRSVFDIMLDDDQVNSDKN